ncbi:MAG: protein kinase domain-containing protein [Aureliella sp.]
MKAHSNKVGSEPIAGYTLRKRLGAGGYGEVWLADAPGGLQKAIKLVFGAVNESQATSELKSLQRIKEISHPFLLSLERIEIVDDQVVIVTELAESSLLDRFERFQNRGEPGIPRGSLLEFLHDTADGLDFLAQKHNLQHLDVKPGNLLIIADRVKVADFGLVKDLKEMSQSMVSGLTPTYSAPEIFDGKPDHRSDQYSLAIVYMEMLTGHLPFDGSTTGEIARQHLTAAPNLEALPPADRNIVGRALSKNPLDRFSSCKQFIEQLQKVRSAVVPDLETAKQSSDGTQTSEYANTQFAATVGGLATEGIASTFEKAIDAKTAFQQFSETHCLFVSLGGLGGKALSKLQESIVRNCDSRLPANAHQWLAVDTDADALSNLIGLAETDGLNSNQTVQIPVYKPIEYRDADPELLRPLSRRWLYNIPKSQKTEGVRPIAVLAMLDHFEALRIKLKEDITKLIADHEADEAAKGPIRIYLMSSLHGGTGSGLLNEFAFLIRQVLGELNFNNYRLSACLTLATTPSASSASMPAAAALSCLSELHYLMGPEAELTPIYYKDRADSMRGRPFDWVTLVDGGLHGSSSDSANAAESLANIVLIDSTTVLADLLAEPRAAASSQESGWLRSGCASPVEMTGKASPDEIARICTEQTLRNASEFMRGPRGKKTEPAAEIPHAPPSVSGDIPLTEKALGEFRDRLLKNIGVISTAGGLEKLTKDEDGTAVISQWARRLSSTPEIVSKQLFEDINNWKNSISNVIRMRMYNWRQVEQIQLNVIEGVVSYAENDIEKLTELFRPFESMLGPADQMRDSAARYLRIFSEECIKLLSIFQSKGKQLAKKYSSWHNSLLAEREARSDQPPIDVANLPSDVQALVKRVMSTLEEAIQKETMGVLDDAMGILKNRGRSAGPLIPDDLSLQHVLVLARDVVTRYSNEIGVDFEKDPSDTTVRNQTIRAHEVKTFAPGLARFGGRMYRFAVTPHEQRRVILNTLSEQRLEHTTTVVPGPSSLGSFVVCDGVQTGLSHLLTNTCRPTPQTLQLAERLRTRVDIEWPQVNILFEIVNPIHTFAGDSAPVSTPA